MPYPSRGTVLVRVPWDGPRMTPLQARPMAPDVVSAKHGLQANHTAWHVAEPLRELTAQHPLLEDISWKIVSRGQFRSHDHVATDPISHGGAAEQNRPDVAQERRRWRRRVSQEPAPMGYS